LILGHLRIQDYLTSARGIVTGSVLTDGKDRQYRQVYVFADREPNIGVQRADGNGDLVLIPKTIKLDEELIAFFGLYSGDGAKGSDDKNTPGLIIATISFSQKGVCKKNCVNLLERIK
jgi:hypothetical protein